MRCAPQLTNGIAISPAIHIDSKIISIRVDACLADSEYFPDLLVAWACCTELLGSTYVVNVDAESQFYLRVSVYVIDLESVMGIAPDIIGCPFPGSDYGFLRFAVLVACHFHSSFGQDVL